MPEHHVLGDSHSDGPSDWPVEAFGSDLVNHSVSGNSLADFVGVVPTASAGEVWWIMLGTNDAFDTAESAAYEANLQSVVGDLVADGVTDIRVISTPYVFDCPACTVPDPDRSLERTRIDAQEASDFTVCEANTEVTCWVSLRHFASSVEIQTADMVHFTEAGHSAVADLTATPYSGGLLGCAMVGPLLLARIRRGR